MVNNISNLNKGQQVKQVVEQQNDVQQKAMQAASSSQQTKQAGQDSVSITPQAQQMSQLQKKSGEEPIINQKKIQQLQKAIASGEYKINPDKLAASIANFEFNLN